MQPHTRAALAAGFAVLVLWPLSSSASTVIFGRGFAHDCSMRALHGDKDIDAINICTDAIEEDLMSDADYAKTLVNRGVVNMRRSSFDNAERDFNRAQAIKPDLPEIYVNRAVVLMGRKQYQDAVAQLDRGIALGVDELEKAYYDRALAKEKVGDVKGAYLDFRKASDLKPDWEAPKTELTRFNVVRAPS
jgi:Flp pilus assembly protein TadD